MIIIPVYIVIYYIPPSITVKWCELAMMIGKDVNISVGGLSDQC